VQDLTQISDEALLERSQHGEYAASAELIVRYAPVVLYYAERYCYLGLEKEDLMQEGMIALLSAIRTYRGDRGAAFRTYASRCIENEILMYLRKSQNQRSEISIDEPLKVDWDGNEMMLSDILGTEPDIISRPIEQSAEQAMLLSAVDRLSDRERQIMHLRFGLRGGTEHTQKEVADAIGISQSYISRLEKRILSRLRRELHDL